MAGPKQARIEEQEREIWALRRNVADLKARHDLAVTELSEIAQGIGSKPPWYTTAHDWLEAVKYKAGRAVATIAKMPLREGP